MSYNHHFSDDEQVIRLWDKEKIRELMARRCYYVTNNWRRQELNDLWVRQYDHQMTASYGFNKGYVVGMERIAAFYVAPNEQRLYKRLKEYSDACEDVAYNSLNLGLGFMATHTTNTHLVELADDGLTAQYCACDCGQITFGHPDGSADEYYLGGQIFADLVKEEDGWRIWHLKIHHDHTIPAKHVDQPQPILNLTPEDGPPEIGEVDQVDLGPDPYLEELGTPDMKMTAYIPKYGWCFTPQMMPKPYPYFDCRHGFGPEGQFDYNFH